jgi:hypothetical protein
MLWAGVDGFPTVDGVGETTLLGFATGAFATGGAGGGGGGGLASVNFGGGVRDRLSMSVFLVTVEAWVASDSFPSL